MRRVKDQNKTLGQLYREIEKQTGVRSPALNGPALPDAGVRAWCWFQDLSRRRGYQIGMAAVPQPIPFSEVRSYFDLTGEKIDPWQRRLLTDLDDLYLSITGEEGEAGSAVGGASALKMALTDGDGA
jgi:hypothetical protein